MGFAEAQAHLEALGVDAMKGLTPSLHRIEAICEALNNPERSIPAIHVTGTNGKTSTAHIASSLLTATGLTVGTFTSPHLTSIRERIKLGGVPITEDAFGEMFDHLHPYLLLVERKLGEKLSYFEVLCALFFLWAAETVDAAVIEVGLGGRWDATNVTNAPVAAITNIGLDHTALLGSDRKGIAREKAGIIKPDAHVVVAEQHPELIEIIRKESDSAAATISVLGSEFSISDNRVAFGGRYLSLRTSSTSYEGLFLPLHGSHQGVNGATALEAVTRFLPRRALEEDLVTEGFATTKVPGRLESLKLGGNDGPTVVVDVAHNPEGVQALVSSLVEAFAFEKLIFVVSILDDKDHRGILMELTRVPCEVILTSSKNPRSVAPARLQAEAEAVGLPATAIGEVSEAVSQAMTSAGPNELICVTGSHYVVGEVRALLAQEDED